MHTLDISVQEHGGKPTLYLKGKLTSHSLNQLQRACLKLLQQIDRGELVIDMSEVTYVDSLSMGQFVLINKMAVNDGKKIVLVNQQKTIRDAFRMLHVDKVIEVRE